VNWFGFYDPESGISDYQIGVGTAAGLTDISELVTIEHSIHQTCISLDVNSTLVHNHVYYIFIVATNNAIVKRNISAVSDGGNKLGWF